ncbi:hypothetical protein VOLCADRAFT_90878 [Volvox carteri f. nagariensis]|uniref:Ribosomal RNA-processing protein 42 n=1 Tax=Volvox carteri f. nagariensis TaxID=3068 RepID=D8TVA9_VOLCA|nr:uncharacterized protein VOLCADRAFT_90878 [Volvox carteri f. nagariensis]EFJ48544.1 hypothetical protein VOLCADRAFT_90878 [Volvox carteri f. nagariensis]|eukprot:XP_002950343.1 hypothetical protein VOLCADRAFT_90878 [Volvox carteri f. nagariensis]
MASTGEAAFCQISIENDVRLDGRSCHDMRPVELELGVIAQAAGSARLRMGATDVIVGVKVEVGSPSSSAPNQGRLQVTVEFSPCASPIYKGRFGETYGEQIAAVIESSLAPSGRAGGGGGGGVAYDGTLPTAASPHLRGAPPSSSSGTPGPGLDLSKLCILPGKTAWVLFVDALVLNDDGNVLGAVSAATLAALQHTRIPKVEAVRDAAGEEEIELDDSPGAAWRLDVSALPLVVTTSRVGSQCVMDLTAQEERCSTSALHVAVNRKGQLCGTTLSGRTGVETSMLLMMMETAQKLGPILWDQLMGFLQTR